jgi:hypothetical protein
MESYDSLVDALTALRQQGYTEDFNLERNCLACRAGQFKVFHDEFEIDKYFRFEGASNPDDQSILYAISSPKHGIKGVLVNAYGIYSDEITDEMLEKLKA